MKKTNLKSTYFIIELVDLTISLKKILLEYTHRSLRP